MRADARRPLPAAAPMLPVKNLESFYGPIMAIRGVSLEVREGQIVTVLGANGAGKTTLLKTISGVMTRGRADPSWREHRRRRTRPRGRARGIVHVPEGREVFPLLTVRENLRMGAFVRSRRDGVRADQEMVFAYFPILRERAAQAAGTLSGGQQQMLAIGRGLMARPS